MITVGEKSKLSFISYPIHGLETLKPDRVTIPFADGHVRQLPSRAIRELRRCRRYVGRNAPGLGYPRDA